jgi:hypothetical protein
MAPLGQTDEFAWALPHGDPLAAQLTSAIHCGDLEHATQARR